nr:hypothetical protein [Burkholderia latens]
MQILFEKLREGKLAEPRHDGARYLVGLEFGIAGAERQCADGCEHLQLRLMAQRGTGEAVVRHGVDPGYLAPRDQVDEFVNDHFVLRIER